MSVYEDKVIGDFEIFEKYFISSVEGELSPNKLVAKKEYAKGDFLLHMYVMEKYYWRNNSYYSLVLTLEKREDEEIGVTAICSGSGSGLFGFDWGADERSMDAVKQAISQWNKKLGKRK